MRFPWPIWFVSGSSGACAVVVGCGMLRLCRSPLPRHDGRTRFSAKLAVCYSVIASARLVSHRLLVWVGYLGHTGQAGWGSGDA